MAAAEKAAVMGILAEPAQFIRDLQLPKGFSVCELGDQWITYESPHRLAEGFYRELGAKRYWSIDGNGRGTVTYDLNQKWGGKIGLFDLVTDFGTAEHIFNQAQVWRTMHLLAKRGGFIAFDKPIAGYPEHGFYNYHRCFFLNLAEANRYHVVRLAQAETSRGSLLRGIFQKTIEAKFQTPQQGRYRKLLRPITGEVGPQK